MRKIVHVITRFIDGGADENTLLTCNHQARAGDAVWLVHGAAVSRRMLDQLDPAVGALRLPSLVREISPLKDLAALVRLARLFRRIRPDVVHTHTSKAGIVGRLASLAVPRARVFHGVHILPFVAAPAPVRLVYIALERLAALRTRAFIDVSPEMRALCLKYRIGRPERHFVVPSGMEIARFRAAVPAPDLAALRARLGPRAVLAGYLAALEPRKRHRALIEALAPVLAAEPDVHLALAGDGHERPAVEALVAERGLGTRVHVLGFRDDPERVIAACDFCLFASLREGLPRAVVQYAAAGKATLATSLPGIEIVLRDGENGYVVAPDDMAGLARRFAELARDAATRKAMAAASATLDLSDWEAAAMARRIEAIYG